GCAAPRSSGWRRRGRRGDVRRAPAPSTACLPRGSQRPLSDHARVPAGIPHEARDHLADPWDVADRVHDPIGDDAFHGAAGRREGEGHVDVTVLDFDVVDEAEGHDVQANLRIDDLAQGGVDRASGGQIGVVHAGFLAAMRAMTMTWSHAPAANTIAATRASSSAPRAVATATPARPETSRAASTFATRSENSSETFGTRCLPSSGPYRWFHTRNGTIL